MAAASGAGGHSSRPVALYALVYVSKAARALKLGELQQLQAAAQARNFREGVTGVLLYSAGTFMQYLEGPSAGLSRVYDAIKVHPWHYGVVDLVRESIKGRRFPGWSLAVRAVGNRGQGTDADQDAQLKERLTTLTQPRSAAQDLLLSFWSRGRSSVAAALRDLSEERARRQATMPT